MDGVFVWGEYMIRQVIYGGTNLTAVATGSVLISTAANTLKALSSTTNLTVLTNNAGAISWLGTNGSGDVILEESPVFVTQINTPAVNLTGGAVIFPATQNASSNANTLDDYEEGTWTPVLKFGTGTSANTLGTAIGNYTKIGNMVFAQFYISVQTKGGNTGQATIESLPFTSGASNYASAPIGWLYSVSYANTPFGMVTTSSTKINLNETTELGGYSVLMDTDFINGSALLMSVAYKV